MSDPQISTSDLQKALKQTANWKSPGHDRLPNFWLKQLTSLHEQLAREMQKVVTDPSEMPDWLTAGVTYLLPKNAETQLPKNYRPITCLPTVYKVLSSILAARIERHIYDNNIMSEEQKGCRKGSYGCKEQLLLNRMVMDDARTRKKNLSMAWIDYQKAYDSVPHSWIIECLRMYNINPVVVNFLERTMPRWKTVMSLKGQDSTLTTREISIKRGIFQGDTLSPLLFCLALNPLSTELARTDCGYYVGKGKNEDHCMNHLLYMDDLKLYASNEKQLESLLNVVSIFSKDICMKFGLDKCAKLSIHRGVLTPMGDITTTNDEQLRELTAPDTYKYLGVEENSSVAVKRTKQRLTTEYKRRVRLVLKTELSGKNKISALNSLATPVLNYSFGVIDWSPTELQAIDRATRKLLTMHHTHHPKAAVERLYLPRCKGGRGLIELESLYKRTTCEVARFIGRKQGRLISILRERDALKKSHSIQGDATRFRNALHLDDDCDTSDVKTADQGQREARWKEKPLHGQHPKIMDKPSIDSDVSYNWLKKGLLNAETESNILAIQDQCIRTRNYEKHILKLDVEDRCRCCHGPPETVHHLLSACPELAPREYLYRHDQVCKYVHWCVSKQAGLEVPEKWYEHQPESVVENASTKILWDMPIITDRSIGCNRPDLTIYMKEKKTALLVDVSIPADNNLQEKTREKLEKYSELKVEVEQLCGMKTTIVPIIIGTTGVVLKDLKGHVKKLECEISLDILQRTAILGTASILRRVLQN
jgi:hypothetical protein